MEASRHARLEASFFNGMRERTGELRARRGNDHCRAHGGLFAVFSYAIMLGHARRDRDRRAFSKGYCFTPGIRSTDFAGTICSLLGGQPA